MLKKILFIGVVSFVFISANKSLINGAKTQAHFADLTEEYAWAAEAVDLLLNLGALSGTENGTFSPSLPVTREQLAKMLFLTFSFSENKNAEQSFNDVLEDKWSYKYIEATKGCFYGFAENGASFNPEVPCTRELAAVAAAKAAALAEEDTSCFSAFSDEYLISEKTAGLFAAAVNAGIVSGDGGFLNPQKNVTRAEAAVILKRAYDLKNGTKMAQKMQTNILGDAKITLKQAISWAEQKGADERFISIAPIYWEYGEKTGIRPEVLYAQAAKETNYGKYTGNVKPEQNNWAGIKTVMATGDTAEDHESFLSGEDGVRGHFNHMCAYVGLSPLGAPHERYNKTVTAAWAGTVKYVEELGGKWAPDENYGKSIVNDYIIPMSKA